MIFKFKNKEKAFTFIELLVALIVLAVGVLSVIAVSAKSYTSISLQRNKLIATNLAREGIEYVRYIRNQNWLYTGQSDCDGNSTITTCDGESPNPGPGQIYEDGGDCDWRCGDEENQSPSYKPKFKLGEKVTEEGRNYFLVDIEDYTYNGNTVNWQISKKTDFALAATETNCGDRIGNTGSDKDVNHFPFARIISIKREDDLNGDNNPNNDLLVEVIVCWKEKGKLYSVSAEEHLFNWYSR